jgi:sigma-E factor negative regulatory protein RseA
VTQDEGQLSASQLSAMFDGELPAAECELLSRRIDRDEKLRARWSRYALIGAAMRSEPVATARSGFAARVGAALDADLDTTPAPGQVSRGLRTRSKAAPTRTVWNTALAASMVAAVAGVSIALLRYSSPAGMASVARTTAPVGGAALPASEIAIAPANSPASPASVAVAMRTVPSISNGEPRSYVTPVNQTSAGVGLQTQLADYMVAHSEYSTPLMRRSLLSALVSNEETADVPVGHTNVMPAASAATH